MPANHVPVSGQAILNLQEQLATKAASFEVSRPYPSSANNEHVITAKFVGKGPGLATAMYDLFKTLRLMGGHASLFEPTGSTPMPEGPPPRYNFSIEPAKKLPEPLTTGQLARLKVDIPVMNGLTPDLYVEKFIAFIEQKGWECAIVFGGNRGKTGRFTAKVKRPGRVAITNTEENLPRAIAGALIGCLDDEKRDRSYSLAGESWP